MKITIIFKDGKAVRWKKKDFTDYWYDGKCFIVIRKRQWVGIYNLDELESVTVR